MQEIISINTAKSALLKPFTMLVNVTLIEIKDNVGVLK